MLQRAYSASAGDVRQKGTFATRLPSLWLEDEAHAKVNTGADTSNDACMFLKCLPLVSFILSFVLFARGLLDAGETCAGGWG